MNFLCRVQIILLIVSTTLFCTTSAQEAEENSQCFATCRQAVGALLDEYYKPDPHQTKFPDHLSPPKKVAQSPQTLIISRALAGLALVFYPEGVDLIERSASAGPRIITIGIVKEGDSRLFGEYFEMLQLELAALKIADFDIKFKDVPSFNANYKLDRLKQVILNALNDPEVDIILTPSLLITELMTSSTIKLNKPVVSAFVQKETVLAAAFSKNDRSTVPNLSFVAIPEGLTNDLSAFKELVPFSRLHMLVDEIVMRADPELADYTIRLLEKQMGFPITVIPVSFAEQALASLGPEVEAVYFTTLSEMHEDEHQKLIDGVNFKKIPSFSLLGHTDVKKGVLAGLSPKLIQRIARRAALNLQQIILGESPNQLSVFLTLDGRLQINLLTAQQIGFEPTIDVLQSALLINEDKVAPGMALTMSDAITIALEYNPNIAVSEADLASIMENPEKIFSAMCPQFNLTALYVDTDDTHAILPPGKQAFVGFELTQMLFDDDLITGYYIAGKTVEKKEYDDYQVKLDVIETVSSRFLDVNYVRELLRIEKKNLELTRDNLALAKLRYTIGSTGKEDIYRWEAEEALRRSAVIEQQSLIKRALAALDQTMGIDERIDWIPQPVSFNDEIIDFFYSNVQSQIKTQSRMNGFIDFSVDFAKEIDPVLMAIDSLIQAQFLQISRNNRYNYTPKVYADLKYGYELHRYGVLEKVLNISRNQWIFTVSMQIPFYDGNGITHRIRQGWADLEKLIQTRRQASDLIEQRVLDSIYRLQSSYPRIALAKNGLEKAQLNLQIVTNRYSGGGVSIVDLLDAQNQALEQEKQLAASYIQYYKDIIAYQRSISWFEFLQSDEEKRMWLNQVRNYMGG